jgi:hypothetical protein
MRGHSSRMRFRLALLLGLPLALHAADKGEPLALKAGLWQVTTTTAPSDNAMVPAALLEKLTPEQRTRVEERMKARKADPPKTRVTKQCLTPQDLEEGMPFGGVRKSCNWTLLTSSSSKVEMRGDCVNQGTREERRLYIQALSPEEADGSLQSSKKGANAAALTTLSTFKAKWIGPECKNPR